MAGLGYTFYEKKWTTSESSTCIVEIYKQLQAKNIAMFGLPEEYLT